MSFLKPSSPRELHVSRARISQLAERGSPVRADGRIDRDEALMWIRANVASHAGGGTCVALELTSRVGHRG